MLVGKKITTQENPRMLFMLSSYTRVVPHPRKQESQHTGKDQMTSPDLTTFKTIAELRQLSESIEEEIQRRQEQARTDFYTHAKEVAEELGMSLDDILKPPPKKRAKKLPSSTVPQYQNEDGQTWSGTGRKPKWLTEAIAEGKTLDDFKTC